VVKIGKDEADGPDIYVPVIVAAHERVNGADIGAGTATHAAQGLGEDRVPGQGQAAVVQEDHVHFLLSPWGGGAFRGAGDPGHVRGDHLAGGAGRQDLEDRKRRVEIRNQLVQPHQGHVHPGQGGDQASVAFVADDPQGAAGGDGEIGPADAHVRA